MTLTNPLILDFLVMTVGYGMKNNITRGLSPNLDSMLMAEPFSFDLFEGYAARSLSLMVIPFRFDKLLSFGCRMTHSHTNHANFSSIIHSQQRMAFLISWARQGNH